MAETAVSASSSPIIRNPAPHRGFNNKAREVLIEPANKLSFSLTRNLSDQEIIARSIGRQNVYRTDSNGTTGSNKSNSSARSSPVTEESYDAIEEAPLKVRKTLGDIGKTRSAGDIFKSRKPAPLIKTFQQMNIMKLPSVDSITSEKSHSLNQLDDDSGRIKSYVVD